MALYIDGIEDATATAICFQGAAGDFLHPNMTVWDCWLPLVTAILQEEEK